MGLFPRVVHVLLQPSSLSGLWRGVFFLLREAVSLLTGLLAQVGRRIHALRLFFWKSDGVSILNFIQLVDVFVEIEESLLMLNGLSLLLKLFLFFLLFHGIEFFLSLEVSLYYFLNFGLVGLRVLVHLYLIETIECTFWIEEPSHPFASLETVSDSLQVSH